MGAAGHSLTTIVASAERVPHIRRIDVRQGDWLLVKTRNSLYTILVGDVRDLQGFGRVV